MNKNTGGPAYPITRMSESNPSESGSVNFKVVAQDEGMTLRDHFAGLAMQASLYACAHTGDVPAFKDLSAVSYRIADAMLAEREKGDD